MLGRAKMALQGAQSLREGLRFAYGLPAETTALAAAPIDASNPLESYFDRIEEGPGIWKWRHYFPIYHRHFSKFVGREVHVVEIGIFSGGSLPMWHAYFGAGCRVYGVDIEPTCRVHEADGTHVFIGDQGDSRFWERFLSEVPRIDIVVDDGGHQPDQQITTLRCLLPRMAMGGVYLCEDIQGAFHQFHSFLDGATRPISDVWEDSDAKAVHQHIASVHRYPALAVIEKPDQRVDEFSAPKHGTEWEPGIYD